MRLLLIALTFLYIAPVMASDLDQKPFDELTSFDTKEKRQLKKNITDYQPQNQITIST